MSNMTITTTITIKNDKTSKCVCVFVFCNKIHPYFIDYVCIEWQFYNSFYLLKNCSWTTSVWKKICLYFYSWESGSSESMVWMYETNKTLIWTRFTYSLNFSLFLCFFVDRYFLICSLYYSLPVLILNLMNLLIHLFLFLFHFLFLFFCK